MNCANYPSAKQILTTLGLDAILVGSAATKPVCECKDIDLVVSEEGLDRLQSEYGYWLVPGEHDGWVMFLPEENDHVIEIFCGICAILDTAKHPMRVSYQQAAQMPLHTRNIHGVEVLALSAP